MSQVGFMGCSLPPPGLGNNFWLCFPGSHYPSLKHISSCRPVPVVQSWNVNDLKSIVTHYHLGQYSLSVQNFRMSVKTLIVNNNVKNIFRTFNWIISGLWFWYFFPNSWKHLSTADDGQKHVCYKGKTHWRFTYCTAKRVTNTRLKEKATEITH